MSDDRLLPPSLPETISKCESMKSLLDICSDNNDHDDSVAGKEDFTRTWKEFVDRILEEVEGVGREGAVEWAELQLREKQAQLKLDRLQEDITAFRQECVDKVESLVQSLTSAVSNLGKQRDPRDRPLQEPPH